MFFGQDRLCTNGLFNLVEKDMVAAAAWKLDYFKLRRKAQIVNNECDKPQGIRKILVTIMGN